MSTNRIGKGTCNVSVNMPTAWRRFLGRKAFAMDVSMGELVRRLVLRASHVWRASAEALSAERDDLEAFNLLRTALADGLKPEDRPAVERAMALILRSADKDERLANGLNLAETKP